MKSVDRAFTKKAAGPPDHGADSMYLDMGRIIGQTAQFHAGLPAVINTERGRSFSFAEMEDISNRTANLICAGFGLGQGRFFATLLNNDNMALFHPWLLKSTAGAAWLDSRESTAELLNQMDHVEPGLVFLENEFLPALHEPLRERGVPMLAMDPLERPLPGVWYFWDQLKSASSAPFRASLPASGKDGHICVLRFTGGTTGRAKCAAYTLMNLYGMGLNPSHFIEPLPFANPRVLLASPLNHAAAGSVVIPAFTRGGCIVTMNKADTDEMGRMIEGYAANLIYTVPTVAYRMLETNLPAKFDMSSLKTIRYGGASMSPAKLEALLAQFGPIFVQGYGSTEAWPSVTMLGRGDHDVTTREGIARLASVGRPVPGMEVKIVDNQGNEAVCGGEGEILVRGVNTISGYYKDPEQTAANFTSDGFWKSGDVAYMDQEGYVFLMDRKKDMVVTGGYNVYATEVENCLTSHPAVENCAVVGVPDEMWGEAVWASVVLRQGATASPQELIAHCKERLARYKAPKRIVIVPELPLSSVGKVLRREVRAVLRKMVEESGNR